ncbi:MAG TPA: SMC family ATPase, partial [Verrucomicrobiae bacterium]|nr:SMC family ATPase [Verrucomicrobiae bacterium]
MSYAQAELGFQGIHTACLTGNNGNGKSALLDAMTWAIWGQARGVEKHGAGMDDLVRLGCEEMAVEFQFELDEQVFQVIRKRDKRRQASALEFQVYSGEGFRSLTGDKLGDTQAKINQVLKMDYETFTNSAFILQGKADTFTTQKASDRKRILGEILGLSYYDRLERRARDKMNLSEAEVKELDRAIRQMEEELAGENPARLAWETAKAEKMAMDASLLGQEKKLEELAAAVTELQGLDKKKQELLARIASGTKQAGIISSQVENLAKRISGLKEILAREEEIAAGYQKLQEVQAAEETANAKQARALELMQRLNELERQLAGERAKLQGELAGLKSQIMQGEKAVARGEEARASCLTLEKELVALQEQEKEKAALQGIVIKIQGEIAEKDGELRSLDKELKDLRERFKTLHLAEAQCPLCSNSLSQSQKDVLLAQMTAEGTEKKNSQARLAGEIAKLKEEILVTEKKINSIAL